MKKLLLQPFDVLFFKDARPMLGSLAGQGATWPLPHSVNQAIHAALHRHDVSGTTHRHQGVHGHPRSKSQSFAAGKPSPRRFGFLTTAGPFPVRVCGSSEDWYFPRPLDAGIAHASEPSFFPIQVPAGYYSSLPKPLKHPVANAQKPSKATLKPWWSRAAWEAYLGCNSQQPPDPVSDTHFCSGESIHATESTYGIALDPTTGTVEKRRFYSAQFLRMKECLQEKEWQEWKLGVLASASRNNTDLLAELQERSGGRWVVGGQQRLCRVDSGDPAESKLPLPYGLTKGFVGRSASGKVLVKWILLSPAVWPQIDDHPGGWLPSWIDATTGKVLLRDGPGSNAAERRKVKPGEQIKASLVAAITGKPVPITGHAVANKSDPTRNEGGAKSMHLAVPAGSVYYFECDVGPSEDPETEARKLAHALNWNGAADNGTVIRNRRSTLMGEKGLGLGVCGTWNYQDSNTGHSL